MIVTRVSADGTLGVVVEVNCETDFVGRSDDFTHFAGLVAEVVARQRPATIEALHGHKSNAGKSIAEKMNDLLAKVGEKIDVRRFDMIEATDGAVSSYTHLGNKIGVLVEVTGLDAEAALKGVGRDVAMQVAAMNPSVVSRDQVDKDRLTANWKSTGRRQRTKERRSRSSTRSRWASLEKYYQEFCLVEQTFIKDPGKTIKDVLAEAAKTAGKPVAVRRFIRFHLGGEVQ